MGWVQSVRSAYKSVIFKSLEKCNKTTNSRKCLYSEELHTTVNGAKNS